MTYGHLTLSGSGIKTMPGTAFTVAGNFVMSGTLDVWFLVLSLPLMCYGLFFILTVEMPDVEADAVTGKRNFLVRHGTKGGAWLSLAACALGTLLFLIIYSTDVLGQEIDFGAIALFSLVPLAVAAVALLRPASDREGLVGQVKLNFASMMGFLLLADILLSFSV